VAHTVGNITRSTSHDCDREIEHDDVAVKEIQIHMCGFTGYSERLPVCIYHYTGSPTNNYKLAHVFAVATCTCRLSVLYLPTSRVEFNSSGIWKYGNGAALRPGYWVYRTPV